MAKRKPTRPRKHGQSGRKRAAVKRKSTAAGRRKKTALRALPRKAPARRKRSTGSPKKPAAPKRTATKKAAPRKAANTPRPRRAQARISNARPARSPRLDRERRTLDEGTLRTPPSSLDMARHGSSVSSGRADIEKQRIEHQGMPPSITAGDVDVNVEDAYFTGDEAPGGDNPPPDMDVVDEIGKALGVQYDDSEELRGSDKVTERDKHRWEMDPASADDYKDRK